MIFEFVVSKIEASQDETNPYVYVVFSDTKYPGERKQKNSPFGPIDMNLTSPEDLMKNLPNMMRGIGGVGIRDSPTFKLSIREYEESGIKIGDKVKIEIKKSDSSGI
jgi:hypothetical protein